MRRPIANPLLDVYGEFPPDVVINPYAFAPAASFTPTDISGCVLWLKADGDVYNTGTTQATDGQAVETWKDASGNSRDATWVSNRALFDAVNPDFNNKPAIVSNSGQGEFLFDLPTLTSGTLFFVGKAAEGWNFLKVGGSSANDPFSYIPISGTAYLAFGCQFRNSWTTGVSAGDVFVLSCTASTNAWTARIDGQSEYSTGSNTFVTPYSTSNVLKVATSGTAVVEMLIYDSALGTTDREAVEDYLGAKYGITITH